MPILCFDAISEISCSKQIEHNHKLYAYVHNVEYIKISSIQDIVSLITESEAILVISNHYMFYDTQKDYRTELKNQYQLGLFHKSNSNIIDNNLFILKPSNWSTDLFKLFIKHNFDFNHMINSYIRNPDQKKLQNIQNMDYKLKITASDFMSNPANNHKPLIIDLLPIHQSNNWCNFVNNINTRLGIYHAS